MRDVFYSYKIKREIPFLNEEEYNAVVVHLKDRTRDLFNYMKEHNCSMSDARANASGGQKALVAFEKLTGVKLEHPEEIYVARRSLYGQLCPDCTKPFRTPRANLCAECGFILKDNSTAR